MRLARYFGTSPEFWINLQARYDRDVADRTASFSRRGEGSIAEFSEKRSRTPRSVCELSIICPYRYAMSVAELLEELRRDKRRRACWKSRVFFFDGQSSQDCIVRDLSLDGAKLEFQFPFVGPNEVTLQIGLGELARARVRCEVKWRRGNNAGVAFVPSPK